MSFKIVCAPQITLASKIYLQLACGYPAPTPFPSPAGRPFEAICPKTLTTEGDVPPDLLGDPDSDNLPNFVEQALGTNTISPDGRTPAVGWDLTAKVAYLQVSEPVAGSGVKREIQIGDGLTGWRSAVEGADYTWADLGDGSTSWTHDGVTYRVARNTHPMTDHANGWLRLQFTLEG